MKVLLYLPEMGGVSEQLKGLVEASIPEEKLEVYRSLNALSQRMRQPFDDLKVAVFMAANYEELMNIFFIRHLLREIRLVLIIPDQRKETVALAHQLRPRFLTSTEGDLSTVATVLSKMLESK